MPGLLTEGQSDLLPIDWCRTFQLGGVAPDAATIIPRGNQKRLSEAGVQGTLLV